MTQPNTSPGIAVPPDLEVGVYANAVAVWHTRTEFGLDFLTNVPGATTAVTLPDGSQQQVPSLRVVSRVKLPPAQIFELMKALEQQLTMFEAESSEPRKEG